MTDTTYRFLLGLDGAASIGGRQQQYYLLDEFSKQIYEAGELENAAYEMIIEKKSFDSGASK